MGYTLIPQFNSVLSTQYTLLKIAILHMKVYPGQRAGGMEADMMAANELNAHTFLQVGRCFSLTL